MGGYTAKPVPATDTQLTWQPHPFIERGKGQGASRRPDRPADHMTRASHQPAASPSPPPPPHPPPDLPITLPPLHRTPRPTHHLPLVLMNGTSRHGDLGLQIRVRECITGRVTASTVSSQPDGRPSSLTHASPSLPRHVHTAAPSLLSGGAILTR